MTGYQSKKKAALDEEGMYLVHHTKRKDYQGEKHMSIEAMKQMVEALEAYQHNGSVQMFDEAITTGRQAIAEAEKHEPVVWMYQDKSTHEVRFQKHMRGFVDHGATYETPLYTTTPPQRKWVGLTDEETSGFTQHEMSVVKYVSKVLQEKNT